MTQVPADYIKTLEVFKTDYCKPIVSDMIITPPPSLGPPSTPGGLSITFYGPQTYAEWNEVSEYNIIGYNIYRSLYYSSGFTKINSGVLSTLNYIDQTVLGNHSYYYRVTSVNDELTESEQSASVFVDRSGALVGFGTDSRFAYASGNPVILRVNTLSTATTNSDSTHGSLGWAIGYSGARIILIEVSGTIDYTGVRTTMDMGSGECYLVGHSAPFPGLEVYGVNISTADFDDILIKHITAGHGDVPHEGDCITTRGNNIVVDRCSLRWGTDETASGAPADSETDLHTVSRSLLYEPLMNHSRITKDVFGHPYLCLLYEAKTTHYKNLLAFGTERFPIIVYPSAAPHSQFSVINNWAVYGWLRMGPDIGYLDFESEVIIIGTVSERMNNDYTNTPYQDCAILVRDSTEKPKIYISDLLCQKKLDGGSDADCVKDDSSVWSVSDLLSTPPFSIAEFAILSSADVKADINAKSGSKWRDKHDIRVLEDAVNSKERPFGLEGNDNHSSLVSGILNSPLDLPARAVDYNNTDGDMSSGYNFATTNYTFSINATSGGVNNGTKNLTLNSNCANFAAVLTHINAVLATAGIDGEVEAYNPGADTTYVGLRTLDTGPSEEIIITNVVSTVLGLVNATYLGESIGLVDRDENSHTMESLSIPANPHVAFGGITMLEKWIYDTFSEDTVVTTPAFYFSESEGSDSNGGQTEDDAFQTIDKLNTMFAAGTIDRPVYLKCGDEWNEALDTDAVDSFEIGSYGSGAEPKLTGKKTLSGAWTYHGSNLWSFTDATIPGHVRNVIADGVHLGIARSALRTVQRSAVVITGSGTVATVTQASHGLAVGNTLYITGCTETEYNGTFTVTTVVDVNVYTYTLGVSATATPATGDPKMACTFMIQGDPGDSTGMWNGAELIVRTSDFTYEQRTVLTFLSDGRFYSGYKLSTRNYSYAAAEGRGFYIQNHIQLLNTTGNPNVKNGDWTYDYGNNRVYMYCDQDPATEYGTIQVSTLDRLAVLDGSDNFNLHNVQFEYANEQAIIGWDCAGGTLDNLSFKRNGRDIDLGADSSGNNNNNKITNIYSDYVAHSGITTRYCTNLELDNIVQDNVALEPGVYFQFYYPNTNYLNSLWVWGYNGIELYQCNNFTANNIVIDKAGYCGMKWALCVGFSVTKSHGKAACYCLSDGSEFYNVNNTCTAGAPGLIDEIIAEGDTSNNATIGKGDDSYGNIGIYSDFTSHYITWSKCFSSGHTINAQLYNNSSAPSSNLTIEDCILVGADNPNATDNRAAELLVYGYSTVCLIRRNTIVQYYDGVANVRYCISVKAMDDETEYTYEDNRLLSPTGNKHPSPGSDVVVNNEHETLYENVEEFKENTTYVESPQTGNLLDFAMSGLSSRSDMIWYSVNPTNTDGVAVTFPSGFRYYTVDGVAVFSDTLDAWSGKVYLRTIDSPMAAFSSVQFTGTAEPDELQTATETWDSSEVSNSQDTPVRQWYFCPTNDIRSRIAITTANGFAANANGLTYTPTEAEGFDGTVRLAYGSIPKALAGGNTTLLTGVEKFSTLTLIETPVVSLVSNGGGEGESDWTNPTSGVAEDWSVGNTGTYTASIVTGNGFTGNAQRMIFTDSSGYSYLVCACACEIGKTYDFSFKARGNTNTRMYLDGSTSIATALAHTGSVPTTGSGSFTASATTHYFRFYYTPTSPSTNDWMEIDEVNCWEQP